MAEQARKPGQTRTNEPDSNRKMPTETSNMTLRSILIPHDGSILSGAIADSVGSLIAAGASNSAGGDAAIDVTLLHVREGASEERGDLLHATAERLRALGGRVVHAERISADVAGAIVDYARETRPDLVAMSTHGRGGLERWTRGSVAERVLRACPVPLWMVNPRTRAGSGIQSILVPLDGSDHAARVFEPLLPLARAFGARMTLLFVDWDAATDTPSQAAKRRAEREREVEEWLADPLERIRAAGLQAEIRIVRGDTAEQILNAAEPGTFDLLAMSTHGRSGASRWLLGSVAEKVLAQSRIPVFVQRAQE